MGARTVAEGVEDRDDFIALRLAPAWSSQVVPILQAWAHGERVDEKAYRALKVRPKKR